MCTTQTSFEKTIEKSEPEDIDGINKARQQGGFLEGSVTNSYKTTFRIGAKCQPRRNRSRKQ